MLSLIERSRSRIQESNLASLYAFAIGTLRSRVAYAGFCLSPMKVGDPAPSSGMFNLRLAASLGVEPNACKDPWLAHC